MKDLKKRRRAQGEQARAELLVSKRLWNSQIISLLLVIPSFVRLNVVQSSLPDF